MFVSLSSTNLHMICVEFYRFEQGVIHDLGMDGLMGIMGGFIIMG